MPTHARARARAHKVHDAHSGGVTALATTSDCARVLSGGGEGLVRVWRIGPQSRSMVASMREHKARVTSIVVRPSGSEFASASSDGSCIVWDMGRLRCVRRVSTPALPQSAVLRTHACARARRTHSHLTHAHTLTQTYAHTRAPTRTRDTRRLRRNTSLLASTNFTEIAYHPDESQLLTTGADRKVTYWDAFDGQVRGAGRHVHARTRPRARAHACARTSDARTRARVPRRPSASSTDRRKPR